MRIGKSLRQWGICILVGVLGGLTSFAAVPTKKVMLPPPNKILVGGDARQTLSLLGAEYIGKKTAQGPNAERLKLTWGNAVMEPWIGSPGYFHIEYRASLNEAIIELSRTLSSFVDANKLKAQIAQSAHLKNIEIDFDRITQNMILRLSFKGPVELKASTGKNPKAGTYLAVDFAGVKTASAQMPTQIQRKVR